MSPSSGPIYRASRPDDPSCPDLYLDRTLAFQQKIVDAAETLTPADISGALARLGFRIERFKTGTPCRLNGRTIDYSQCELQPGDDDPEPFSFLIRYLMKSGIIHQSLSFRWELSN